MDGREALGDGRADFWVVALLVGILASVGLLPLWPGSDLRAHDLQRLAQCVVLLLGAVVCGFACPSWSLRWTGLGFGAAALWSVAQSAHPVVAGQELVLWLGLCGLAVLASRCRAESLWVFVMRGLVLGAGAYALIVIALLAGALINAEPLHARSLCLGFDNPRFLNHCQTVLLPWLAWCTLRDPQRGWRVLAGMGAAVHVGLAILCLARATGVAWAVMLLVMLVAGQRQLAWRFVACVALGVACALLLFDLLPWLCGQRWATSFVSPTELGSDHSRGSLWQRAWQMFVNSPWHGVGPMHYAAEVKGKAAHPHNIYLQMLAELGGPAVLLGLAWVVRTLAHGWRSLWASSLVAGQLVPAFAAVVAALVDGSFSGNFVMPLSQLLIAVSFGALLSGLAEASSPVARSTGRSAAWHFFAVALVASQGWLLIRAAEQVQRDPPRLRVESPQPLIDNTMRPRFWLNGWI